MYYLYAEDTRDGAVHPIAQMRSVRFSRAMREAEKTEKARGGARYFIARPATESSNGLRDGEKNTPDMSTAAYLGVRQKPAPVGSPENQAHQRKTLRIQKSSTPQSTSMVDWEGEE